MSLWLFLFSAFTLNKILKYLLVGDKSKQLCPKAPVIKGFGYMLLSIILRAIKNKKKGLVLRGHQELFQVPIYANPDFLQPL